MLPVLEQAKQRGLAAQCMNNLRQVMIGWRMYADDNSGTFPPNPDYNAVPRWVAGDMRGSTITPISGAPSWPGIDATNEQLLIEGHYSVLGPYLRNTKVFKCPADQSTWGTAGAGRNEAPRVRTYSMSQAIGCAENGTLQDTGHNPIGHWLSAGNVTAPGGFPWKVFFRESTIQGMSPADLWVLLDEHPNSINDAAFAVQMPLDGSRTVFIDVPSKVHNNGCGFSFADGHSEIHNWQDPGVIPSINWRADVAPGIGSQVNSVPKDPDVLWLAHRTSCLASGAPTSTFQP